MRQKGSAMVILIVSIVVIFTLIASGYYIYFSNKAQPQSPNYNSTAKNIAEETTTPSNEWKEYVNAKYSFTIKYPPDATIKEVKTPDESMTADSISIENDLGSIVLPGIFPDWGISEEIDIVIDGVQVKEQVVKNHTEKYEEMRIINTEKLIPTPGNITRTIYIRFMPKSGKSITPEELDYFHKVVATFHATEGTKATSDLKIFTAKDNLYQISVPSKWNEYESGSSPQFGSDNKAWLQIVTWNYSNSDQVKEAWQAPDCGGSDPNSGCTIFPNKEQSQRNINGYNVYIKVTSSGQMQAFIPNTKKNKTVEINSIYLTDRKLFDQIISSFKFLD